MVLPCAPATAIPYFNRMSSASISARGMVGIPFSLAAVSSGFSGADSRGKDNELRAFNILGVVAHKDFNPVGLELPERFSLAQIGAGDVVAVSSKQFSDTAHADTAHADKVYPFDFVIHNSNYENP